MGRCCFRFRIDMSIFRMVGAAMVSIATFVHILDLGGTFVFAISGAVAAVNRRLDIFGILVLSFVAGNFGGISRDLLIGAVPPAAVADVRYLLVSILAGLITFFSYAGVEIGSASCREWVCK